jgi:hypothetical protein
LSISKTWLQVKGEHFKHQEAVVAAVRFRLRVLEDGGLVHAVALQFAPELNGRRVGRFKKNENFAN